MQRLIPSLFSSGIDACASTIASHAINPAMSFTYPLSHLANKDAARRRPNPVSAEDAWFPCSMTFAGFGDGSVAVFDDRVPAGRVHLIQHEHTAWVIAAYVRMDVPEIVTASVHGSVKFSDLRSMRSYKKLVVQKSLMTALAVHPAAPIMAAGDG